MKLNAKKRNSLPGADFAVPGRKYPVNDASHARNALARVAQHGTAKEKAEVQAKVARKYPGIQESGMKKSEAKKHESTGMKKMVAKRAEGRKRESWGMKLAMGEDGKHKGVGAHEGTVMSVKKSKAR